MIDLSQITRAQMIEMAVETRKKVTSAEVSQIELNEYPVHIEKLIIPTSTGDAITYLSFTEDKKDVPLIINIHGGGFIRERTISDEIFCRKLNHRLNCKVIDIDYKIAPEYPFPTALNECYEVVKWAFSNSKTLGVDEKKIIIMGHSAGGNLTAGIEMLINENQDKKPLCLVIEYPPMDLFTDPDNKEIVGKGIPAERARLYNLYYCDRQQQKNPYVSPVFADEEKLKNFPPTLIITAGEDSLCTEAEIFALNLSRAGNEVTLKRFKGVGHGFTIYRMDGHEDAFALIKEFVDNKLKDGYI